MGCAAPASRADLSGGYTDVVFGDGFESGSLIAWGGALGTGTATVSAAGVHAGSYGVRLSNALGQYELVEKTLPSALTDSSTSFWMRTSATSGFILVAQARDAGSSRQLWTLLYDAGSRGFYFYPYRSSGSIELSTGPGVVAAADTWVHVEVRYNAASNGGAQLYVNDQTQPSWGTVGDFTQPGDYRILQLWDDGSGASVDFDDVTVARPSATVTAPGAPTDVSGTPGDGSVALGWTAPASDGGSPITGYRITPYIGTTAQTPIDTGSTGTQFKVTGLSNGTTYAFTVAAINAAGIGPASAASAGLTPQAAQTVVSLTFDDDIQTQWQAFQMLQSHNMRGTFYVNSGLTADFAGWRLSWPQLAQISAAGDEIGGHSWDHADLTRLSPADQQHEICDDRANIQAHGLPLPTSFAYPFGGWAPGNVDAVVRQCGYSSGRQVGGLRSALCATCPFAETIPPANPMVTNTAPDVRIDTPLSTVEGYVTQAEQHGGGWVQLVFHDLCTTGCTIYSTTPQLLNAFLDWLQPRAANGTVVKTVGEVINGS